MEASDFDKFMSNVNKFAEESGKYFQGRVRSLPDSKIIRLAQEGNTLAQEEAERRQLNW